MRLSSLFACAASAAALLAAPAVALTQYSAQSEQQDVVDTAVAADGFNTLVAAVQAADLVDTLKGEGPFTVFAPTDEAFAALPDGTLDTLLMDENQGQLVSILTYHVVPGEYKAEGLDAGTYTLDTVQGDSVEVVVGEDGSITVDGANVVTTDIDASNGVIHVIDAVIQPGM